MVWKVDCTVQRSEKCALNRLQKPDEDPVGGVIWSLVAKRAF